MSALGLFTYEPCTNIHFHCRNPDRDPSLVLNNDHDLSSSTPFLHIHAGQPLPALELGGYNFVNLRYDDCIECKKLTRPSSRSRHGLSLNTWYRYPLSRDLWRALLMHHEKSK